MREPKNQMLGTMEPPLMQLSVNDFSDQSIKTTGPILLEIYSSEYKRFKVN